MASPTLLFGAIAAAIALLSPAVTGADVPVGSTGFRITIPAGFEEVTAPGEGLLLELREEDGDRGMGALRFGPDATGQRMSEAFELRMRRRYERLVLTAQERVTVLGGGAMCRTYQGNSGETRAEVEAVILVRADHRLVLFSYGTVGSVRELRSVLLSLKTGAAAAGEGPPSVPAPAPSGEEPASPRGEPPAPEPPPESSPKTRPGRPLKLPGTGASILPPAGWRGGRHAPTKGVRIVDPDRACIIDVSVAEPGERERNEAAVERAADDFEKRLGREPARWKRVDSRRERIGGRNAWVRRFEGAPGDLPCDFVLLVTRVDRHVIIARSIYPQVHRDRYQTEVLESLRSIGRR